jgi:hypothetical protein
MILGRRSGLVEKLLTSSQHVALITLEIAHSEKEKERKRKPEPGSRRLTFVFPVYCSLSSARSVPEHSTLLDKQRPALT